MPQVEIIMPDLESAVMDAIYRKIDAAIAIGTTELPKQIQQTALGDGVDIDGQPLRAKKPRPKNHPRNNPRATLVGEDVGQDHMMSLSRWSFDRVDAYSANVIYDAPDYYQYVIESRPWLTPDRMNESVRLSIEALMRAAIEETI